MKKGAILAIVLSFLLFLTTFANAFTAKREFFSAYNVTDTTNYVVNEDGDYGDDDAWWHVEGLGPVTIGLKIPTLGSTTLHLSIEGKINGEIFEIYPEDITATITRGKTYIINEVVSDIRVGFKVTTNGTDSVTCHGMVRSLQ